MLQIVVNEALTWPQVLQTIFNYMQSATVIVPVLAVLA